MTGSVRSLLAPWLGGVSGPSQQKGYRSLLAFWMGGVCPGEAAPDPEPTPAPAGGYNPQGGGGRRRRRRRRHSLRDDEKAFVLCHLG